MKNLENFSIEGKDTEEKNEETVEAGQEEEVKPEFERDMEAIEEQEREINEQIKDSGYEGILTRLSKKGRKFAGISALTLASFAAGCGGKSKEPMTPELEVPLPVLNTTAETPTPEINSEIEKAIEKLNKLTEDISKKVEKEKKAEEKPEESEPPAAASTEPLLSPPMITPEVIGVEPEPATEEPLLVPEKNIGRETIQTFDYFIENSNIVALEDGSFAVDIVIGSRTGPVVVGNTERPCYVVTPEILDELENIKQQYLERMKFAKSKRPFSAKMIEEGLREKAERAFKRVIVKNCEKMPASDLPDGIKQARVKEQQQIKDRKRQMEILKLRQKRH